MNKPRNYDETQGYTEYIKIPKGGYICKIIKLEETKSRLGNDMIVLYLDIAEGEYKDHYSVMYRNDTRTDKKWRCVYYQPVLDTTTGDTNKSFKGAMTAIEESNNGFIVERCWGKDFAKFFKGKLVGAVFGEEFYYNNDKKLVSVTKPMRLLGIESIHKNTYKIPDDVYPKGAVLENNAASGDSDFTAMPHISESDLPF